MQIGDKVIIQDSPYSFNGEIGIVSMVWPFGSISVTVPTNINPFYGYCIYPNEWRKPGVWTDELEAEKDLENLLSKYKTS